MNDLISRSVLLAYLENEKRKIKADSKKYRMHEEAVAGMKASLQAIENKVNEMPTAYDVSEVIKELEESSVSATIVMGSHKFNRKVINADRAISIVKAGGIDE